jgi:hypothetical protein
MGRLHADFQLWPSFLESLALRFPFATLTLAHQLLTQTNLLHAPPGYDLTARILLNRQYHAAAPVLAQVYIFHSLFNPMTARSVLTGGACDWAVRGDARARG